MARKVVLQAHRWLGIAIALFLLPAALSGSLLVFKADIDRWLNPELHYTTPNSGAALSEAALRSRVLEQLPGIETLYVDLPAAADRTAMFAVTNWPGAVAPWHDVEVFVDPATGTVIKARQPAAPGLNRLDFIHWLRKFHFSLMQQGPGVMLMGAVAVAWLIDCIGALVLTLPRTLAGWPRWGRAWKIKRARFNFDLHRAAGLWFWLPFFVLAISSVSLNLGLELFIPVTEAVVTLLFPQALQQTVIDKILEIQYSLHTGEAFGLAGRGVVFLSGLAIVALIVTGLRSSFRKLRSRSPAWDRAILQHLASAASAFPKSASAAMVLTGLLLTFLVIGVPRAAGPPRPDQFHQSETGEPRNSTMQVELAPGRAVEVKAVMSEAKVMTYSWTAQGGPVYTDFHGHDPSASPAREVQYATSINVAHASGSLVAPFAGEHGWYWQNRSKEPVTVTVRVSGYFEKLVEYGGL